MSAERVAGCCAALLALASVAGADAPPGRYAIAPPEVRDTMTGLIWAQAVPATGGSDGAGRFAWEAAKGFCPTLGAGWRLPTVKELLTIVDVTQRGGPSIDRTAFPDTPPAGFWTATAWPGSPANNAWWVSFDYGGTGNDFTTARYRVRCVR